jgi:hypothetical protein
MPASLYDALLLKCAAESPAGTAQRWHDALALPPQATSRLQSVMTRHAENGLPMQHVYVHFTTPMAIGADDVVAFEKVWMALSGHTAQVSRLQSVMHLASGQVTDATGTHYAVETDPEAGWETEIFKWYDEEHMPALSRVPGCWTARRFLNLDHSPRSLACYDLERLDVLTTEAWLAVRATAWSDICRPHFTNTLRTQFQSVER